MNKLLMCIILLGFSSCAMYEQWYEPNAEEEVVGEKGGVIITEPSGPRFDGKDYNDDFGEYDD